MPKQEESSSFELPPVPPTFELTDESPDPEDVIKPSPVAPPAPLPEPIPKPKPPEPVPSPEPTPSPTPEPVPIGAPTPPEQPKTAAQATSPDTLLAPEDLAREIHTERTLQEKLIAEFEGTSFPSPTDAVKRGIELIKELRLSLERQAVRREREEKFSPARLQHTQLGILLRGIADVRDRGEQMPVAELTKSLRSIFNFETAPHSEASEAVPSAPSGAPAGVREAPRGQVATEAVNIIPSPDAALAKPLLDAPTFDTGAAMDVAGFPEFLAEAEASGAKIDMADERAVRKHFEAFVQKDALAGKVAELCAEKILGERGIALGDEGVAAVREYLERQAHLHPEALAVLSQKFARFDTLSADVARLNEQLAPVRAAILTPEQQTAKTAEQAELQRKAEALALAEKTNRFWPSWKSLILRDATGWGRLSTVSKRARAA
ncbi:MAG: hypothetical protein HYS57_02315, partial [Parcubacteria group bacterium]|nr:hypothetical protein [Parcubacteria group bacterium]